ncbi:hypothetical protein BMF94_3836 [Rhodotorula taiwanensis]|uniref:Rhodanese domain-containing protein n=1 Tax=Rhodotorula taiwanensis TaxID=741276 RepID=A0A2S5B8N7_9BASI|nr:hypothetical protein BMF94_3836 [Rhodotorula taiwanensis]
MQQASDREQLLAELEQARQRVQQLEAALDKVTLAKPPVSSSTPSATARGDDDTATPSKRTRREWPLGLREYMRYGRQMMLPQIGLAGQLKLKNAHVLVVGAGGLGCPVLLYLAAAGVGEITILDHDTVELSNLHRQVLHTETRVGMSKALSAKQALDAAPRTAHDSLNSDVRVHAVQLAFTPALFHRPQDAPKPLLDGTFTLVLDCTDNPATRHFLNAYAAAHQIPLVSGGAVRAEGTVGVFSLPASDSTPQGPCYACVFPPSAPSPPPPIRPENASEAEQREYERLEDVYYERLSLSGTGACADEGVIGILCGVVGIGMASEAMRVLLGTAAPTLHLYSPLSASPYRTIKMRSRKLTCPACGTSNPDQPDPDSDSAERRWRSFLESPTGEWPGWSDPLCELPGVGQQSTPRADKRIRVEELQERTRVIDTRPAAEYGIASVEGSVNIPFPRLLKDPSLALASSDADQPPPDRITFICRRGNDSLLASRALRRYLEAHDPPKATTIEVDDVVGGLSAWARQGEEGFPIY